MKIEKNSDLLDLPLKSAYRLIAATIPSKIFICIHRAKCFAWVVLVGVHGRRMCSEGLIGPISQGKGDARRKGI